MINWLMNTFQKLTDQDDQINYVIAEYHATQKKKREKRTYTSENEFELEQPAPAEYMQIDRLHQNI